MNNISDEGCVCIAEGLQVCQTLQSIDLGIYIYLMSYPIILLVCGP